MNSEVCSPEYKDIYEAGLSLGVRIQQHLALWPQAGSAPIRETLPEEVHMRIGLLEDEQPDCPIRTTLRRSNGWATKRVL
jgi:hypothetical protein